MAGIHERRWWPRLIASLLLAGAALALLSRSVGALPDSLAVAWWVVPAYLAILLLYFFTRAWRWWFLVRALGPAPLGITLQVALAGFFWIILLPWRLGELARPILLSQATRLPAPQILGTIALERVTDGLTVCGLFFLTLGAHRSGPRSAEIQAIAGSVSALFLAALIVLIAMALWPRVIGAAIRALLGRIHGGVADRLGDVADGIAAGLRCLPSPRPLLAFLAVNALYWSINAVGMVVLARGCGLDLGLIEITAVMTVINLALLVPGAPGHLGTFQLGVLGGLALVVPQSTLSDAGLRYAVYLYTTQIGVCVVLGVWSSARLGVAWRPLLDRLLGGGAASEPPPTSPP
ncbi:MAG: flippase-like domain-containing protein [Nannocystis sp.]|nr:flippase-like domain-containing protein [Nannocystis sp.]